MNEYTIYLDTYASVLHDANRVTTSGSTRDFAAAALAAFDAAKASEPRTALQLERDISTLLEGSAATRGMKD